jgi:hypothetical protein
VGDDPFFDLEGIERNLSQFRLDLIDHLKVQLGKYYIKPPAPNTILGKLVETIRFTSGFFNPPQDLIETIEIGIGECGYYYDIHISPRELSVDEFMEKINLIQLRLNQLETDLETKLSKYYFPANPSKDRPPFQSISNIDLTIETPEDVFGLEKSPVFNIHPIVQEHSERVLPDFCNIVQPVFRFNIYSEAQFTDPVQFQRRSKYLERDRFVEIHRVPNHHSQWRIIGRGAPLTIFNPLLTNTRKIIGDGKKNPAKNSAKKHILP